MSKKENKIETLKDTLESLTANKKELLKDSKEDHHHHKDYEKSEKSGYHEKDIGELIPHGKEEVMSKHHSKEIPEF